MKLSDGEKLILVMLSEIYGHLKIKGEVEAEFVKDAITSGQSWALKPQYPGIFDSEDSKEKIVEETGNILDMWRVIERSYEDLSDADKKRVEKEADPFGKDVKFSGFDGNSGEGHLGIARFMVKKLDWYPERNGDVPNSHSSASIEGDRRMLPAYRKTIQNVHGRHLNADELIAILKEQTHPSMR